MTKNEQKKPDLHQDELILQISNLMDTKLSVLEERMDLRFEAFEESINLRFEALEAKFDSRIDSLETKFDSRINLLETKFDSRIDSLEAELRKTNIIIENDILPRLNTIEKSYTDSYFKYRDRAIKIDSHDVDISAIKSTVIKLGRKVTELENKSANA